MFTSILANVHHQLVINTPKALSFPSSILPFNIQKKCLLSVLENAFHEAIEDGDLDFLQGKWLKIEITDLHLKWYVSFADGKLVIEDTCKQEDVSFSGKVNELILIVGRKEDPDTLFFQRRLSIQGDTELGLEVKNLLDNIDFDHLPPLAQKALNHFSDFIKKGIVDPNMKISVA